MLAAQTAQRLLGALGLKRRRILSARRVQRWWKTTSLQRLETATLRMARAHGAALVLQVWIMSVASQRATNVKRWACVVRGITKIQSHARRAKVRAALPELRLAYEERMFHRRKWASLTLERFCRVILVRFRHLQHVAAEARFLASMMDRKPAYAATLIQKHWRRCLYGRPAQKAWRHALELREATERLARDAARRTADQALAALRITRAAKRYFAVRQRNFHHRERLRARIAYMTGSMHDHAAGILCRFARRVLRRTAERRAVERQQWLTDVERREKQRKAEADRQLASAAAWRSLHVRIQKTGRGFASRRVLRRHRILCVARYEAMLLLRLQRFGRAHQSRMLLSQTRTSRQLLHSIVASASQRSIEQL